MNKSTLQITWKGAPIGIIRKLDIYLDNKIMGRIGYQKTEIYSIPPGEHTIQAKMDWTESPIQTFYIHPEQTRILICGGRYKRFRRQNRYMFFHPKTAWIVSDP